MNNTLNNKTIKELRVIAKNLGLKGVSRLKKEDMIQAILNKVSEQVEIVNNMAELNQLAKSIVEQEVPMWNKVTGDHDTSIIKRALTKLNATTPITFAKDSRISNEDKLPIIAPNGKKSMLSVSNILKLASKIKEETTMTTEKNEVLSAIDMKIRSELQAEAKAKQQAKEEAEAYMEAYKETQRNIIEEMVHTALEQQMLISTNFEDRITELDEIVRHLQSIRVSKLNKETTFSKEYAKDIQTVATIIENSFSKEDLVSKDNFEKRSEYDALIEATLIRADLFDYKQKDSEINKEVEIADLLLAEARHIAFARSIQYINNCFAKHEDPFKVQITTKNGKTRTLLTPVEEKFTFMVDRIVWAYRRVHGTFPKLPVKSFKDITSNEMAKAIISKYNEYLELESAPTLKQTETLFKRFVKWGITREDQVNKFISMFRSTYTFKQASTIINITYSEMKLIINYKNDKEINAMESALQIASMQESTRELLKAKYNRREFNYSLSLYTVEDDK